MDQNKLRKGYTGYLLTDQGRAHLLAHIDPVHPDVVAHHVTHEFGVYEQLPPDADHARVIAVASNDVVQAAVVKVNGTTARESGGVYHITVSVNRAAGGTPKMSNDLLADRGNWTAVDPFNVQVEPQFFPF
jgi:hypothetical protein